MTQKAIQLVSRTFDREIQANSKDELGSLSKAIGEMGIQLRNKIEEISKEKDYLQTILKGMMEGVLVVDGRGRILMVNDALRNLLSLSSDVADKMPLEVIRIGNLLIDIDRHYVSINKSPIRLTSTEFKLLVELASKRGRVQTREHLLDKVWGYTYEGYARTVDTHIKRLREKLGPLGDSIETIRGVGYRFREENE